MKIDETFQILNACHVHYILIGGVNFLLNHEPYLTYDLDIWVRDDWENLSDLNKALIQLEAKWGPTEETWQPVSPDPRWLQAQAVFCLTTKFIALDVFRELKGLEGKYQECLERALSKETATGHPYLSLCDQDMLTCQLALPEERRHAARVRILQKALNRPA